MRVPYKRTLLALAVAEIAYLAVANVALNAPATQAWINRQAPEKILVSWERAWSWLPFHIHATGIVVNGQSWSAQWQAQVAEASAFIGILPLLRKTIRVTDLDAESLAVFVRPRLRPSLGTVVNRQFFPIIPGRDPDALAGTAPPPEPKWKIVVEDGRAHGDHTVWVSQFRGTFSGAVGVSVTVQTRAGPLAISEGEADVALEALSISGVRVTDTGRLAGTFSMGPFLPRENRGVKAFGFLRVDAEIDVPVESLAFLDFYLKGLNGLSIDGSGRLQGRVTYADGDLTAGSDLTVTAETLALKAGPYRATGNGHVDIDVVPAAPDDLRVAVRFNDLHAVYEPDPDPLVIGENLEVVIDGPTRILPGGIDEMSRDRVRVTLPKVSVPDLAAYQRYVPDKWGIRLTGGSGQISGHADISAAKLDADLTLDSQDAELAFDEYAFETNLALGVSVHGTADERAAVEIAGAYLRLDKASLTGGGRGSSDTWHAYLTVNDGDVAFDLADTQEPDAVADGFLGLIRQKEFKAILASADGWLDADLSVSSLNWINVLFKNPFSLMILGSGEVAAQIKVLSGWLAKGTTLKVEPRNFQVEVLEYLAEGSGAFTMAVEKGGPTPDMRLDAGVRRGSLRRRSETKAFIEQVTLDVTAEAKGVTLSDADTDSVTSLDISMPTAKVADMTVYNQYLPRGSPLRLVSGQADLTAKMRMGQDSAKGYVRMQTSELASQLDNSSISGKLILDVNVRGGTPDNMEFDIGGSSLRLEGVNVTGPQARLTNSNWQAGLDLQTGRVVWKKPTQLSLDATLAMQDTRPLVAILANERKKHGFIDKLLTVDDVRGRATLRVDADRIVVPYALAAGGKIEVGAKGIIEPGEREGMFYVRYGSIGGVLEVANGRRNFSLFGARRKFDSYNPATTRLAPRGGARPQFSEANSGSPFALRGPQ